MDYKNFKKLKNYLEAVQYMEAQGPTQIEGSLLSICHDADILTRLPEISGESEKLDSKFSNHNLHIRASWLNLHLFTLRVDKVGTVSVQGDFNQWGEKSAQNWDMEIGSEGDHELYMEIDDLNGLILYRFVEGEKTFIDPKVESVSFLPKIGVCQVLKLQSPQTVSIKFLPNKKEWRKVIKAGGKRKSYQVASHPFWLIPDFETISFKKNEPAWLQFSIARPLLPKADENDSLVLTNVNNRNLKIDIPVILHRGSDFIYAELKQRCVKVEHAVSWGENIEFAVPMIITGKGTIKLIFFGNGVSLEKEIIHHHDHRKEHNIPLRLDTGKISPIQAKSLKIRVLTNSKIANRRYIELEIQLNIVRLVRFPVFRLNWQNVPFGEVVSQVIEFYRSDSMEPAGIIKATPPDNLAEFITIRELDLSPHAIDIGCDTKQLNPGTQIIEKIAVRTETTDGLVLRDAIPIKLGTVVGKSGIDIFYKQWCWTTNHACVDIRVKNIGTSPLKMFFVKWTKNKFRQVKTLWEAGQTDNSVISPGNEISLLFTPNRKSWWLLPILISDSVHIKSNCGAVPDFIGHARIWLSPKILSKFCFFSKIKPAFY